MSYAIIGFGAVGQALAAMFARKDMEVTVAATRAPEELADKAKAIGPKVLPATLDEAVKADTVLLAVPFWAHKDVAAVLPDWTGKTVIDVTNSYGIEPADLGNLPSSAVIARAFTGGRLVKAFNHLAAAKLAADPAVGGGRRVIFLASDDADAVQPVAELVEMLGFAPVELSSLGQGGQLVQAHGRSWAPLIFQDLVKVG